MKKRSKLAKWVEKCGGTPKVARKLGVTEQCVNVWTRCDGFPKVTTMQKIVRMSKGALTYADLMPLPKNRG